MSERCDCFDYEVSWSVYRSHCIDIHGFDPGDDGREFYEYHMYDDKGNTVIRKCYKPEVLDRMIADLEPIPVTPQSNSVAWNKQQEHQYQQMKSRILYLENQLHEHTEKRQNDNPY